MRLIDADALEKRMVQRLVALRKEYGNYDHYTDGFDDACQYVEDAETIDVVGQFKAQMIRLVKSFEVLIACTGVSVLTRAVERATFDINEGENNELVQSSRNL